MPEIPRPLSRLVLLTRRTVRETLDDNGLGLAAQLAYYFLLSLFPALIFVVALIGLLPIENVLDEMLGRLASVVPQDVLGIIRGQLRAISQGEPVGLLTAGILGALWSSSVALSAIIYTVNRAYDIKDTRPFWKTRGLAILLTTLLVTFIVVSFGLVLVGPRLAETLAAAFGLGIVFEWAWKIAQWPIVFALVATAIGLIYYVAPAIPQGLRSVMPGAVLATILWLGASLGFKFYVSNFSSYNETYGTIGGIIVLMTWFYLSALSIIIGAELNAELNHLERESQA